MRTIIGKKQAADNATFVQAWQHIEELVSRDEAASLVERTIADIREKTAGKRVGYAWSGGKDSLALQYVCEQAGVHQCVLGVAADLEYPAFLSWVEQNRPANLRIWNNENLTMQWVAEHPDMLFPQSSQQAARWFSLIQHRAQARFFKERNLDIIALGRRVQDGNYTGGGLYTDAKGITRYSPIKDWKHEEILAVIHYFMGDNLPPIYQWENGWVVGTGVFAARQYCKSVQDGWAQVYRIDPSLVIRAAHDIPSAYQFLKNENQQQHG